MIITLVRTLILYGLIVLFMRLMGKRQIGELDLTDLITTLLISEIASLPITDSSIPLSHAIIPIVTLVGGSLPGLFAGAMITETLFQIPGIGYTAYQAMVNGDIPFYMFYSVFLATLTLLGTLLADILYAVVDPRVRIR